MTKKYDLVPKSHEIEANKDLQLGKDVKDRVIERNKKKPLPEMIIHVKSFVACHQQTTLLPLLPFFAKAIICVVFIFLIIFNIIMLAIGIVLAGVLTKHNTSSLTNMFKPTAKLNPSIAQRLDTFKSTAKTELTTVGVRFICLGLFSLLFLIAMIVSLCGRFQIAVFLLIVIFFIIGLTYLVIGFSLIGYIEQQMSNLLHLLFFKTFDAAKCYSCSIKIHKTETNPTFLLFEEFLMVAGQSYKCCGIKSAEDYLPYNANEIPPICCPLQRIAIQGPEICQASKAFPGCLRIIMDNVRSKRPVYYMMIMLIFIGILMLLVVLILILESVAFFLRSHQSKDKG